MTRTLRRAITLSGAGHLLASHYVAHAAYGQVPLFVVGWRALREADDRTAGRPTVNGSTMQMT